MYFDSQDYYYYYYYYFVDAAAATEVDVYCANELHSKHKHTQLDIFATVKRLRTAVCLHNVYMASWRQNKHGPAKCSRYGLCRSEIETPCGQKIFNTRPDRPTDPLLYNG
jgi:hypothetical protein